MCSGLVSGTTEELSPLRLASTVGIETLVQDVLQ